MSGVDRPNALYRSTVSAVQSRSIVLALGPTSLLMSSVDRGAIVVIFIYLRSKPGGRRGGSCIVVADEPPGPTSL
jgi:hypothetical protein